MVVLLLIAAFPAYAEQHSSATLVADVNAVTPNRPFRVALELTAAPGWHTYWHNPGDAGAATEFDLSVPAGPIVWPLPQRIADGSVMSFAYTGTVLLARTVTPTTAPLSITAHANWLVCQQICIPQSATLTLSLPAGPPTPSPDAASFAAAHLARPAPFPAHIAPDGTLWLDTASTAPAVFLPDAADTTLLAAPQPTRRDSGHLLLKLTPTASFRPNQPLSGLLLVGSGDAEIGYTLTAQPAPLPDSPHASSLAWATIGLALAGGLVLNLMPCVFPVLAMKAMGLAALGGAARREVRLSASAYTAGVLVTFTALGILLLSLRAAGAASGWGFQFQWPAFVAAMAWLLFGIGLSLSGAFSIGTGWTGIGQSLAARGGSIGSFATGLLAVLVATPCTAPFMGAAIAAAATAPAATALCVFIAMGIGFAAPTLLLAARPSLLAALPRPGLWMRNLQQGLAFPMYAAAVWLVWVQSQETGPAGVLGIGSGFVLIAAAAWLTGIARTARRPGRTLGNTLAIACLLGAVAILPGLQRTSPPPAITAQTYTPTRLQQLREAGHPVLVNMTAAWCVTCLVNENAALRPALPALTAAGVTYLTGDWTRQDPAITDFLRHYGRDGVPLYVFFPAANGPARILPQILTPGMITALSG